MSRRRIVAICPGFRHLWSNLLLARRRGEHARIEGGEVRIIGGSTNPFAALKKGSRFGKGGATVKRIERLEVDAAAPAWFQPKRHSSHIAIRTPYDSVVYIETTFNDNLAKSNRQLSLDTPHPFDLDVERNRESTTEQLTLLETVG